MKPIDLAAGLGAALAAAAVAGEPVHEHPAPERLGKVQFATSCAAGVQQDFERAVALLHSFAYRVAAQAFQVVAERDPHCAMAHWGIAMSLYHQLWSPPAAAEMERGRKEIDEAHRLGAQSERERQFIAAAAAYFGADEHATPAARAQGYLDAMAAVAGHYPQDTEAQVFYALALLATAPPTDRTHANQKRAAAILEPVFHAQPEHPGAAHYLIHAYDSAELAPQGLAAARAYSKIAPSAPHALHMPSHIFTRLGLWDDSIASNQAARVAARAQADVGEELHAMDYLTYAYLQRGREADAEQVVADLRSMGVPNGSEFKVGYAATAMPVRLAMERQRWSDAESLEPLPGSAPQVAALVYWARAVAPARAGRGAQTDPRDVDGIETCQRRATAAGDTYWATQIEVLGEEARGWRAAAAGQPEEAVRLLGEAADREDALEKLPVTPGPVIPAREQLGELLLGLHRPQEALRELTTSLASAPGRRGGLMAAMRAAQQAGDRAAAARFQAGLRD
jgi:hypothetical protein